MSSYDSATHRQRETLCQVLESAGFSLVRVRGSHHFYSNSKGKRTVVPVHGNRDIPRPFLADILRQADIPVEEYLELLKLV